MNHCYLKAISVFFVIGFLSIVDAAGQQNSARSKILRKTNVARLYSMKTLYAKEGLQKRQKAKQMAAKFGWKVKKTDDHGNFMELQEVSVSGNPKYYVTHGSRPFNLGSAKTTRTTALWSGGTLGLDLNGEGMNIGAWDGGAVRLTHQEFDFNDLQADSAVTVSNHATHVAGTLVGLGTNPSAKGMAGKASLRAYDWNRDEAEMAEEAANGLLVSNHSYGWSPLFLSTWEFGYYDEQAATWDAIQYNAPYYLVVKSAGNDRNDFNTSKMGYDLVNGASTSKNALVVTAVEDASASKQPSDIVMSDFSSWGPTDDGRIKPDISAKGVAVFSSYGTGDDHYSILSGTSMAAPNVTGSLVLLQQHYNNLYGEYMRASTLKALVINTAAEAGDAPGPDYQFGWGLLNAAAAALLISDNKASAIMEEATLYDTDSCTFTVTSDGLVPLKASLVWTDPAGTPGPVNVKDNPLSMLINDLDIRILKDTTRYEPWVLDPANPSGPATTADNATDNVEVINIDSPKAGDYTIIVTHKRRLEGGSQDFSLVVSGVNVKSATVCKATVPDSLATAYITDSTATISWSTGIPGESYDYRYRKHGAENWTTARSLTNSVVLSGLQAETDYDFQVRSNCKGTSSHYSERLGFTTISLPLPCPVTTSTFAPTSDITDEEALLEWARVTGATSYNCRYRPTGAREWMKLKANGNAVTLSELIENTAYEYQIQTVCYGGNSPFTKSSFFTTKKSIRFKPTICRVMPQNLTAATTAKRAEISWSPVEGVVEYQYRYSPVGSRSWVQGKVTANAVTLKGLKPGTRYIFQMRARCGDFSPIARMVFSTLAVAGVQLDNPGGIKGDPGLQKQVVLYPNPAFDKLHIGIPDTACKLQVSIYNVKGVTLIDNEKDFGDREINITTLPPGMYFVRVITHQASITRPFIKK